MQITSKITNIRTIRPGDTKFMLTDGFVISPRAGFEISDDCPYNHLQILQTCIDRGWIKPVAHVYGKELTMDALR
jgi:hypothetical protein